MSKNNIIQQKIKELDGGSFQNLFDRYLTEKYGYSLKTQGVEDGTNKTTKGTPDTYIECENGKYIFVLYGTVKDNPFEKLKKDILSCFDKRKVFVEKDKIEKIILGHTSSNITVEQSEELKKIAQGIPIQLISISDLSYDLLKNFQRIAYEDLGIPFDSLQIYSINDFIRIYNKNSNVAPIDNEFLFRKKETEEIINSLRTNEITIVNGASGCGKTKIVIESLKRLEKDYTVLCVMPNGLSLESDLNIHIVEEKQYILFLDDANNISNIDYIFSFIRNKSFPVKLIITVRDYLCAGITEKIYCYSTPNIIKLTKFSNEEISEILKKDFGILNQNYISQICAISKGNTRLAVMASQIAINKGLKDIQNAEQIFDYYYNKILSSANNEKNGHKILFVIAFLGIIKNYRENDKLKKILEFLNVDFYQFEININKLCEIEIVEIYENEIIKIGDQSLKDYILYYFLIKKKIVLLQDMLQLVFPEYIINVVVAINTILRIFRTQESFEFIKDEINFCWNSCTTEQEKYYVQYFAKLNLEKTLLYVINKLSNIEKKEYNIRNFDIANRANKKISTELEIEKLSIFKRSEYCENAVLELVNLLNKNSDYIYDVYSILSENYIYDEYSLRDDYKNEYEILGNIWKLSKNGENEKTTLLLLEIMKKFLDCEYRKAQSGDDHKSFSIITITVKLTVGLKKLRKLIWRILFELYNKEQYKYDVMKFILNYNAYGQSEDRVDIINFDIDCYLNLFLPKKDGIDFLEATILYDLERIYDYIDYEPRKELSFYNQNSEFVVLENLLPIKHKIGTSYKQEEKIQNEKLINIANTYTIENYKKLFLALNKYQGIDYNLNNEYKIANNLYFIFENIQKNSSVYIEIIKLFLSYDININFYPDAVVKNLIERIGANETLNIIENSKNKNILIWKRSFYNEIPEDKITKEYYDGLIQFTKDCITFKKPYFIDILFLEKFSKIDKNAISKITELIIENSKNNEYSLRNFFHYVSNKEEAKKIVSMYKQNNSLILNIYFMYLKLNLDYFGYLFKEMFNEIENFWHNFITEITKEKYEKSNLNNIIDFIWGKEEYSSLIDAVIDISKKENFPYKLYHQNEFYFSGKQKENESIRTKKIDYIMNFIRKNSQDLNLMIFIFEIINDKYREIKIECILELLNNNNNIEFFKSIPIKRTMYSWSGSLIPLIKNDIEELEKIKNSINSTSLIKHKLYIAELIQQEKVHLKEQRKREYIENNCFY